MSTRLYSCLTLILASMVVYLFVAQDAVSAVFSKVVVVDDSKHDIVTMAIIICLIATMLLLSFIYIRSRYALSGSNSIKSISEHAEVERLVDAFHRMVKAMEDRDQNLQAECERAINANKTKTDFLLNVSHELRTPMHAILNFAELGQKKISGSNNDKVKTYFSRIEESGERLLSLINDILDLTHLESGAVDLEFEKSNLEFCINNAVEGLAPLIDNKKLKLSVDNKLQEQDWVFDKARIMQVVINLLSNAIKFSPDKKQITILLEDSKQKVHISVIDEGIGIPEDEIDLVFDKFIQSSITDNNSGGSGIGLAICKEIIELHGGEIFAKNNKNCGVTFTFSLPKILAGRISKQKRKK